ncbi:MAG: HNH endonuclease [Phycisphaerales bacterium]|nr:HNH endonuclease [Phycisphaerales bacterium]
MYWAVREDGNFEVIDGQQRTISICQYVKGDYSYSFKYYHNLQKDEQAQILNYELMVYVCSGTDSEKLEWFKTINIAGEKLTEQELRNAVYYGSWLSDAKRYFSKTGCPAYSIGEKYLVGAVNRQEYLEKAIQWISKNNIEDYMAQHQHDPNANALWQYYQTVITWVQGTFTNYRKEMKGIEWGELYNAYKDNLFDAKKLENEIKALIEDDDVTNNKGIYYYILHRDEKYLNLRAFDDKTKRKVYEKQKGICPTCKKLFELENMEADHIIPWHDGGKTEEANCQMLCKMDNRKKSGK